MQDFVKSVLGECLHLELPDAGRCLFMLHRSLCLGFSTKLGCWITVLCYDDYRYPSLVYCICYRDQDTWSFRVYAI